MTPAFPKPPTPPEQTALVTQRGADLAALPHGNSHTLSEIINRSLVHLRTRQSPLCQRILADSGLADHYKEEPQRIDNLQRFVQFFHDHDDPARPPAEMLGDLTRRVVLSRNLDFLSLNDGSIPILTVHQSKGLEFDTVFIAGLAEDEFPSYYAKREGKIEEEKRLFYVALTRAKRHLILTCHDTSDWGHQKPPSSFLAGLI